MKFVLFVEGDTEKSLAPFLKRWLDARLTKKIGIQIVKFYGFGEFKKDLKKRAELHLHQNNEIIAVIALIDMYGLELEYPPEINTVQQRSQWATQFFEETVSNDKFRVFFAIHETEAWLLSDPDIFQKNIRNSFPARFNKPESVNFNEPPSVHLNGLYLTHLNQRYRKILDGTTLFEKLDPDIVCKKCPSFKLMMESLLQLARDAGN
jgi:hypothetical protein